MKKTLFVLILTLLCSLGFSVAALGNELVPGLLLFEGFENADAEIPANWSIFSPGELRRTMDAAHTGKYSFEINDVDKTKGMGIRSPLLPITAGKDYVATALVLVESGGTQLYLEYWDEAKTTRLAVPWVSINVVAQGGWQTAEVRETAPADAKYISVIIYTGKVTVGRSYFDDVEIIDFAALR